MKREVFWTRFGRPVKTLGACPRIKGQIATRFSMVAGQSLTIVETLKHITGLSGVIYRLVSALQFFSTIFQKSLLVNSCATCYHRINIWSAHVSCILLTTFSDTSSPLWPSFKLTIITLGWSNDVHVCYVSGLWLLWSQLMYYEFLPWKESSQRLHYSLLDLSFVVNLNFAPFLISQ